ncbi:hypothetical protein STBA_08090 [Streptomyces sp. MP131-18]|nr:hypothetical protein STBA_08090 [Streptomyces sp. MP131-18]
MPSASARARRGTSSRSPRTAICGSSPDKPRAIADGRARREGSSAARSTRTSRSGCSLWAERSRPHTEPPARCSPATAPRVTTTRRAPAKRSSASHWRMSSSTRRSDPRTSPSAPPTASSATAGTKSSSPSRARSSATSAWEAPNPASPSSPSASPMTGHSAVAGSGGAGTAVHSSRNSASSTPSRARSNCRAETGRLTSEPTETTGLPAPSTAVRVTESGPFTDTRTRSSVAPVACSATPLQENGSRGRPDSALRALKPMACRAASRRAGCRPNRVASCRCASGKATSAYTSSPRRQTARSPWKAGP